MQCQDHKGRIWVESEYEKGTKFIMSIQKRFALGLVNGAITHLKYTGLWDLYKLTRSKLDVIFTPPVEWQVYRRKNLLNAKLETVKLFVGEESVSKLFSEEYALTHFMGWNKNQIEQNAIQRFQEQIRHAKEESLLEKVKSGGTIDFKDENLGFNDALKNILLKDREEYVKKWMEANYG
mgnify:CR=1 FL=1